MTDADTPGTTMLRNSVSIEGHEFLLAQNTDVDALKEQARAVVLEGAGYLELVVVGNRRISVLLNPGIAVLFESAEVSYDVRDTGDVAYPFDIEDWGTPLDD